MSRLLAKLQSRETGLRGINGFRKKPLVSFEKSATARIDRDDETIEYTVTVEVGTAFRINRFQTSEIEVEAQKDNARFLIAMELYKDIHIPLAAAMLALGSGDAEGVEEALLEIRAVINPN